MSNTAVRTKDLSPSMYGLAFAGALAFLYLRTFSLPGTPFEAGGDQLLFFSRAVRILHGQILYRDFFEMVSPGTDLLYAAIFWVVGVHAWVMQVVGIALGLSLCCVITRIAGRIVRGPMVLLPAMLFLVFDLSNAFDMTHHWYSTLSALLAVSVLMDGASTRRIAVASALCGVATLFTQTAGSLAFGAMVVYLLWLKRDGWIQWVAAFAPFAVIVCGVLGYYAAKASFDTLFFDLVVFPVRYMGGDVNSPRTYLHQLPTVHGPADVVRLLPVLFIYALVPYIYFLGLAKLRREPDVILRQRLVLLHLVGLGLFVSILSGPRFFRISTTAPFAILIFVWLVREQRMARNVLWAMAAAFAVFLPIHRQREWHSALDLPIGRTAFNDPSAFDEYQWLAQRTHPGDAFFNDPGLMVYLSLRNPAAIEFVDFNSRPEWVAEAVQSLQRDPPREIMLHPESESSMGAGNHSAPFREYVHRHYRLAQTFHLGGKTEFDQEFWELDSEIKAVPE